MSTRHIEATYENGVLKPSEPLDLPAGSRVQVTIVTGEEQEKRDRKEDPLADVIGIGEGPPDAADNHDQYIYGKPNS